MDKERLPSPFLPQSTLYVRASYGGTGLAQHLMCQAQRWAATSGAACIQLYVTTSNEHARAFYRKCGWQPEQEIWRLEMQGQGPMEPLGDLSFNRKCVF
ncbi:hypothetical protein KSD_63000 [Ktedonobacter sp. SOSP1-85]|uniref:GNAT family N-acetyltransferase n=1 Tax=Ktedonobacter sp. SOSP1-85 TaxID=2778367 RepID=UPI001A25E55D|nr:GNAT family N-acetyltransferase [Ktedonobacter sp. SOSP1-85]GHO78529.1 hypothetical protein KSD_63000 [Ktedonobacter sp. SOSP1-85]